MKVTRLFPISYCFGVIKAISDAHKIRDKYPDNDIYFFGDLVHNQNVINYFLNIGIKVVPFTEENAIQKLNNFKQDDIVIFSAHGHDARYEEILNKKGILFFDTTCIKVKKNLNLIKNTNREIIYVGKKGHPETFASLSYSNKIHLYDINDYGKFDYSGISDPNPLILNQSTLSIMEIKKIFDEIKSHFPDADFVDEICDASRVRQEKITSLKGKYDLIVVVGDRMSSNSVKLYKLSEENNKGSLTLMVNSSKELEKYDLTQFKDALIASGTSTPLETIKEVEEYLEGI